MANPKAKTETVKPAAPARKTVKPAAPARKTVKSSGLVAVVKDGEKIEISPLTVENHLQLGWKLVEGKAAAAEKPAEDADGVSAETPAEDPDGGE